MLKFLIRTPFSINKTQSISQKLKFSFCKVEQFKGFQRPSQISKLKGGKLRKRLFFALSGFLAMEIYVEAFKSQNFMYFQKTEENLDVVRNVNEISKGVYKPTFYLPTAFLQIVYGFFESSPYCPYEPEEVKLKDEGTLVLDWGPIHHQYKNLEDMKILIIAPGVSGGGENGGSNCNYTKHAVLDASRYGFRPVVFSMRGINAKITTPTYHCANSYQDLIEAADYIQTKFPRAKIYGMGISMGANNLINAIAENPNNKIKAMVSIGNPFDINQCEKLLIQYKSRWLYNRSIINSQLKTFEYNYDMIMMEHQDINFDDAMNSKTPRQYDSLITTKLFGFKDVDDYYDTSSCNRRLHKVDVPVLFINSREDPVSDIRLVPREDIQKNPKFILIETQKGGHIDWFTSRKARRWVFAPSLQYLNYIIKNNTYGVNDDDTIEIMS